MAPSEQRSRLTRELDIADIGGSIDGCTAAIKLARQGCQVTLFECSGEELPGVRSALGGA